MVRGKSKTFVTLSLPSTPNSWTLSGDCNNPTTARAMSDGLLATTAGQAGGETFGADPSCHHRKPIGERLRDLELEAGASE